MLPGMGRQSRRKKSQSVVARHNSCWNSIRKVGRSSAAAADKSPAFAPRRKVAAMKRLMRFIATKSGFATLAILTGLLSPIGMAAATGMIGSLDIINGQVKTVDLAKRGRYLS